MTTPIGLVPTPFTLDNVLLSRSPDGPAEAIVRDTNTGKDTVYPIHREHAVRLMRRIQHHGSDIACVVCVVRSAMGVGLYTIDVVFFPNKRESFA